MHKISRNHIHKRSNKAVKQLCESHPLIEIEWGKYTSNYLVACHSFTFSFLKFGRKNSFVLLPVVCLGRKGIKKQCIKSFFVDNDEDDKMKSWIRSNLIDDHDFYPNGQVLGIRKAAVVAGVGGELMLDWSATEYNYPPTPPIPENSSSSSCCPTDRTAGMAVQALSDVILQCSLSNTVHCTLQCRVGYPKHYLRLQAAVQRVQQQEYYRMVGFLTASWRTGEEEQ